MDGLPDSSPFFLNEIKFFSLQQISALLSSAFQPIRIFIDFFFFSCSLQHAAKPPGEK